MDTASVPWRKTFLPAEAIVPVVIKAARACAPAQNGFDNRLELHNPVERKWYVCEFVSTRDYHTVHVFAEHLFERLAASGELPPCPEHPDQLISREPFIANLMSVARFRRPEEV